MKSVMIALPFIFALVTNSQTAWSETAAKKPGGDQSAKLLKKGASDLEPSLVDEEVVVEPTAEIAETPKKKRLPRFKRAEVLQARFGSDAIGLAREKTSHLAEELNKVIFGQEFVTEAIEAKVTQYLEDFGHRRREPVHLNLMGFPGSGKTALVQKIEKLIGIKVIILNAQTYVDGNEDKFAKDIREKIEKEAGEGQPVILAVDEIDKVPEITYEHGVRVETTSQFIGGLNSMISEGKIFEGQKPVAVSNVLLLTMMNYPPDQVESFTKEVLKVAEAKSYYDFDLEDFKKFDEWLRGNPGAAHRILAKLYRANTVSRLAPTTLLLQSFTTDVYAKIVEHQIRGMVATYEKGPKASRQLKVEVDPSLNDFFVRTGVVPSSGARETVSRVDTLIGRLLDFAQKVAGPGEHGLDRPRRVKIAMLPGDEYAEIEVTPQIYRDGQLADMQSFKVQAQYIPQIRDFRRPEQVVARAPILISRNSAVSDDEDDDTKEPRLTKKEIRATRFPPDAAVAKGLAKDLQTEFFDQDEVLEQIQSDILKFMSRNVAEMKLPISRLLSGFPGNPGVEIIEQVAKKTELPIIRMNLSQFTGDDTDALGEFQSMFGQLLAEQVGFDPENIKYDGRYILVLEGIEHLTQKDAMGGVIARPVMGFIRDMLVKGKAQVTQYDEDEDYDVNINTTEVGKALIYLTFDLPAEKFKFEADPRMTSVDDVLRAFKRLTRFPADLKDLMSAMYNSDTVSVLFPRLTMMRPYTEDSYKKIVLKTAREAVEGRLNDSNGVNRAQIEIDISDAYVDYLIGESVIASEGATNTAIVVRNLMSTHLEAAMDRLPRNRKYSGERLLMKLNFDPADSAVSAQISVLSENPPPELEILNQKVSRIFPSVKATGPMKAERLETAAHEFGHAFSAVLLGKRMDRVLAVPLKNGYGGFVSFKDPGDSAFEAIGDIYVDLASRAFERIVSNVNPKDPVSVLNIGQGSSRDVEMATDVLYSLIYELGLLPHGGTLDRRAKFGPADAANIFPSLGREDVQKLSLIMHDLENFMVEQFLKAHPLEWYVEKIKTLANIGAMTEREFYELVEYPYPGENRQLLHRNVHLETLFKDSIIEPASEITQVRTTKVGEQTIEERVQVYIDFFAQTVEKRFKFKDGCEAALIGPIEPKGRIGF